MSLPSRIHALESREAPSGSESQTQENYTAATVTPHDFAIDSPHDQEIFTRPAHMVHRRRAMCLINFCLCMPAATVTFTIVVLESSQVRSASITSRGFRAVLLATTMVIFCLFRVGLTDSQLAPQARWDTYHEVIMSLTEDCMVFPVILLNIIDACSHYYGSQNASDYITQVATCFLFLVWIVLLLSGGQHTRAESIDQGSTAVQSGAGHHVGTEEANHRELLRDTAYTFDSFRHCDAAETAASTLLVG